MTKIQDLIEKARQDAVAKYEKNPHAMTVHEMSALPASYHENNRSAFTKDQNQAFDKMRNELNNPAKVFEEFKKGFDLNANVRDGLLGRLSESLKVPQPMFRAGTFAPPKPPKLPKPPEYKDTHWHSLGEQISETILKQGKEHLTEQRKQMKLLRKEVRAAIVLGIISCLISVAAWLFE